MKKAYHLYIIFGVTILITLFNGLFGGMEAMKRNIGIIFIYSLVFYSINRGYFYLIGKFFSWDKYPYKTLITSIIGLLPLNFIIYLLLNFLVTGKGIKEQINMVLSPLVTFEYILVLMFALVISLFIIILYTFKKIETEKLKAEKLKTQNEQAKFESLKAQLDPHFLFNNLNVLTALIEENPEKAEKFVVRLSDIYKYVLQQKDHTTVSLKDELSFSKKYLELLKARFENALTYDLPKISDASKKIPPMSLQILLENIVKHNQIDDNHPLKIDITLNNDYLIVKNNKNPKKIHTESKGLGLELIKKRFELLTKRPVIIEEDKKYFIVKIPLI